MASLHKLHRFFNLFGLDIAEMGLISNFTQRNLQKVFNEDFFFMTLDKEMFEKSLTQYFSVPPI